MGVQTTLSPAITQQESTSADSVANTAVVELEREILAGILSVPAAGCDDAREVGIPEGSCRGQSQKAICAASRFCWLWHITRSGSRLRDQRTLAAKIEHVLRQLGRWD